MDQVETGNEKIVIGIESSVAEVEQQKRRLAPSVPQNHPPDPLSDNVRNNITANQHPATVVQATAPPVSQQQGPVQPQNVTLVIARMPARKSICEAYMLCLPLGFLGLHHFYLRRYGFGFLYFFTFGLCGVGWLVDICRLPCLVSEANRKLNHPEDENNKKLSLFDAYLLWFPLGILGLHHYYMRRPAWGIAYTFSGGLFFIGWMVDCCRMPILVREANARIELERTQPCMHHVELCDAYALGLTPTGILGAHHFYMGRYGYGIFYLMTLGGCGIGWITDWFRMKWLVYRANHPDQHILGARHKFLDDAYVMAFPLGILGLHHFYLERPAWGTLYFFTFGLFGIGWLIDLCRMPCLVNDTNKRLEDDLAMMAEIRQQLGVNGQCPVPHLTRRDVVFYPSMINAPYTNDGSSCLSHVNSSFTNISETPILQPPPYESVSNTDGYRSACLTTANNNGEPTNSATEFKPPAYSEFDNKGYE